MTNWASIMNNSDCVKLTINKLYWDAVEKIEGEKDEDIPIWIYIMIGIGIAVVVAGIALGVICCKRKNDKHVEETTGFTEDD
jgi:hypothetical protein